MGKTKYVNFLDGFRGFCCFFLIAYHWPMPMMSIPFGWEVLQAFFVMSGYLITRILLYDKTRFFQLKDFFSRFIYRRSFRIFPLYFAFIFFWFAVHYIAVFADIALLRDQTAEVESNFGFLLTYTYNFMGFFNHFREADYMGSAIFGHLWSLSLEEQFYLLAPFLVFYLDRKKLIALCIAIIILSPIMRFVGFEALYGFYSDTQWAATNVYRMGFFQMDSFAIGGLLALTGFKRIKHAVRWTLSYLVIVLGIYIFIHWYTQAFQGTSFAEVGGERKLELWLVHNYQHVYVLTLVNFGAAFIFMCFERGFGLLPKVFSNKYLEYLGKISYGIYVIHLPVLLFSLLIYTSIVPMWVNTKYPIVYELVAWIFFMGTTLTLSHLSYKYFESYFLNWKDKLDHKKYNKLKGIK